MSKGHVYVLINDCMPDLIKVGMTTRSIDQRIEELSRTAVPMPFRCTYSVFSPDCADLERSIHERLESHRVSKSREFFRCTPDYAEEILNEMIEDQIQCFVSEFSDKHLVDSSLFIDPSSIHIIGVILNQRPEVIADAINQIRLDDECFDFSRLLARASLRKSKFEAVQ